MTWMSLFLRGRKDVDYTGKIYKSHFLKFFILTYPKNYLCVLSALGIFHGKLFFSGYDIIPMNIENAKSNFSSGTLYNFVYISTLGDFNIIILLNNLYSNFKLYFIFPCSLYDFTSSKYAVQEKQ